MVKSYIEKKEMVEETIQTTTSVTCDFCGKEFPGENPAMDAPVGEVAFSFGYGSKHDNWRFDADICDECFDKLSAGKKFRGSEMAYL